MHKHTKTHKLCLFSLLSFSIFIYIGFIDEAQAKRQCGLASWYGKAGQKTASGEPVRPTALTAAHRKLRFGTKVTVENMKNGRTVVVRINDRGPFIRGRIIDVSRAAAQRLGFLSRGITKVCISY